MKLLLVGAGSHARTVIDLVQRCGHQVTAYVDRVRQPRPWLGGAVPLEASDDDALADTRLAEVAEAPAMGLAGVRPDELARRLALFERYAAAFGAPPPALVHPTAVVADAEPGPGAMVMAGVVVNAGASIGRAAIVNSGAIIEHEAVVGEGAHVAPGAIVLGRARIGASAMLGAGAVVLPGVSVPAGTLVRALTRFAGDRQ